MRERQQGMGDAAKVNYIADVLRELRRLATPHELLTYLIEMAEVEAESRAKQGRNSAIAASSRSPTSQGGRIEQ